MLHLCRKHLVKLCGCFMNTMQNITQKRDKCLVNLPFTLQNVLYSPWPLSVMVQCKVLNVLHVSCLCNGFKNLFVLIYVLIYTFDADCLKLFSFVICKIPDLLFRGWGEMFSSFPPWTINQSTCLKQTAKAFSHNSTQIFGRIWMSMF